MQESIGFGKRRFVAVPTEKQGYSLEELKYEGIIKDLILHCDTHDIDYVAKPLVKIAFGGVVYSECPECAKDRELQRAKEELENQAKREKERKERAELNLSSRGCGKKYLKLRDSLKMDTELWNSGKLGEYLKNDGSNFDNQDNLIILGGVGVGKTFFACKLVETAYSLGLNYILINSFELVGIYKSKSVGGFNRTNSFENIEEFLDGADCVILDEVDYFLRGSKDIRDEEALHHFAQLCEKEDIRTIILGNCNRKELKEGLPPKVYSRFSGGKVIGGWNMQDLRRER